MPTATHVTERAKLFREYYLTVFIEKNRLYDEKFNSSAIVFKNPPL